MTFEASDIEAFIDDTFANMQRAPLMHGTPFALECQGLLLIDMYAKFCHVGEPLITTPAYDPFQMFAKKFCPKRPGPMSLAQWYTDTKWGCAKAKFLDDGYIDEEANQHEIEMNAGAKIVEFFIAWKKDLKDNK